jgi:hypothetical protein
MMTTNLSPSVSTKTPNQETSEVVDGCFIIEEKYGLWFSYGTDGKALVTSPTKLLCIEHTRFYLKGCQEGWTDGRVVNSGVVGGKL